MGESNIIKNNLDIACSKIQKFKANLGETEIFAPLKSIFDNRDASSKLQKYIFLLTDGAIFDPQKVVRLIKKNSTYYIINTFGIGDGVSTELITEWANAGNGKSYFVDDSAKGLEKYVINALFNALNTKIKINRYCFAIDGEIYIEYPPIGTPFELSNGDYFTYFDCCYFRHNKSFLYSNQYYFLHGNYNIKEILTLQKI